MSSNPHRALLVVPLLVLALLLVAVVAGLVSLLG